MKEHGRLIAILILGTAILAVFGQGLHHGFINLDLEINPLKALQILFFFLS